MIARVRAWFGHTDRLAAARAEVRQLHRDLAAEQAHCTTQVARIADLEKTLSTEQMTMARLDAEVKRLVRQDNVINLRADSAIAEAARLRADHTYVAAERCECGGDAELYWRTRAHELEQQAVKDRANAIRLEGENERMQLRIDEADRIVHIAEQLERGAVSA